MTNPPPASQDAPPVPTTEQIVKEVLAKITTPGPGPIKPGDTGMYFEASTRDDRMVGRLCVVVEEGTTPGRYDIEVFRSRRDMQEGMQARERIHNVPFYNGGPLQQKADNYWEWPSRQFFAPKTPEMIPYVRPVYAPKPAAAKPGTSARPNTPAPAPKPGDQPPRVPAPKPRAGNEIVPPPNPRKPSARGTTLASLKPGATDESGGEGEIEGAED